MTRKIVDLWRWLRRLSGDDAYEQYLAHLRVAHPERTPLARAQFWRDRQVEKWSGVNRCC
jgi:uncharacterized short protein YbdD (DUF466 family)